VCWNECSVSAHLQSGKRSGFGVHREQWGEAAEVCNKQSDLKHGGEESGDGAVRPEQHVVEQNAGDEGREDREREGDEAVDEEEEARNGHEGADKGHPVACVKDGHELKSHGIFRRRHFEEAEDVVQAEYKEHKAEKDTADHNEGAHARGISLGA
jgi:hypothetical protein